MSTLPITPDDATEDLEQVREDLGVGDGVDPLEALLAVDKRLDSIEETVPVPLLDGSRANFVFKPLTGELIEECQDRATRWVKKGRGPRVQEMDGNRAATLMIVAACLKPNLNDQTLKQHYRASSPEDLISKALLPGTIDGLGARIMELSGYNDDLVDAGKS